MAGDPTPLNRAARRRAARDEPPAAPSDATPVPLRSATMGPVKMAGSGRTGIVTMAFPEPEWNDVDEVDVAELMAWAMQQAINGIRQDRVRRAAGAIALPNGGQHLVGRSS